MSLLLSALLWSVAGFVIGFFTCWFIFKTPRQRQSEAKTVKNTLKARPEVKRALLGLAILLMLVLSSVNYYRVINCQTDYNKAIAAALNLRSEAQRDEGKAQIELLTASLSGDRARALQETHEYIDAISRLEQVRASNPLPDPPDCGGS
jgi:hypothetical protein